MNIQLDMAAKMQQYSNRQVSSAQTDAEVHDVGIGYDKGACPRDLALEDGYVSRSNGYSQSQRRRSSPSEHSKNTKSLQMRSLEAHQDPEILEPERQSEQSKVALAHLGVRKSKSRATT